MSWSPTTDVVTTIGLTPGDGVPLLLRTSRSAETAYLTIGSSCDIQLDRVHVEALRDQLPDVLAAMDQVATETAACTAAEVAGQRAVDAAATALDQASAAEAVGANELAAAARAAAATATDAANDVDAKVLAMQEAATDADYTADKAIYAADQAAEAVRQSRTSSATAT